MQKFQETGSISSFLPPPTVEGGCNVTPTVNWTICTGHGFKRNLYLASTDDLLLSSLSSGQLGTLLYIATVSVGAVHMHLPRLFMKATSTYMNSLTEYIT